MIAPAIIGFGGGCHWCTEAVFESLKGVSLVEQGWIASGIPYNQYSEAVKVHYQPAIISLADLIAIHLYTHACTSNHSLRQKYRSAVYTTTPEQIRSCQKAITSCQTDFEQPIITKVLPLEHFRLNEEQYLHYYLSNPDKPFCQTYITPKLRKLRQKHDQHMK
ncbi:peptide-methionine (S)-S-oxide reductase [Marinoscillum furvescens]|uniref:peptide-methionine (S)-S-oxide reductase n=1 Tax=Marinoscillum furvescens DSM 4134 TaxID=1122208 RepID=A0A3D9L5G3_MARFU|nr:peptide-methionine (S)-S-oxide reductase [Marinoscillum furvescens]RED99869.1 peptide-methionine (S)-S-oxide reductase [Marinoscillum furvescens DSM 4134]